MRTAKVLMNGRSQAIRLPREFHVKSQEVYLRRTPEGILIMERNPWDFFLEGVAKLSPKFMELGRDQPPPQERAFFS